MTISSLFHPVLPHRTCNKLMFPLCRTCADTRQQTPCRHSEDERALHGTWVTIEMQKAIELGYIVKDVKAVWHFEKRVQCRGANPGVTPLRPILTDRNTQTNEHSENRLELLQIIKII